MSRIESTLLVQKSVAETFAFLNNPESHRRFIPRCVEFKQTSAGAFGQAGTTVKGLLNYFGVRIPVDYEIIEHQPNQRLAMQGLMGPVRFTDGYILASAAEATHITFWLELTMTGFTALFQPFAGLIGNIHAWETLRNLRREIASSG
jgi:ribosome-associated toxin RatA of RatAB toxin-antitoxin module